MKIVKNLFVTFLRSRRVGRFYRRYGLLELLKGGVKPHKDLPPAQALAIFAAAKADANTLLQDLGSQGNGLTEQEAEDIRERVGFNEVDYEKPLPWWKHLWLCYKNPFNLLLTLLAGLSFYTGDMEGTIVISTMVLLSTFLRFWQEARSNKAAEGLKALVSNTATVIRRVQLDSDAVQKIELPINQLVPGDLVSLSAGDMIPADLRILTAKDLFVSQVTMTGESLPVEKFAHLRDPSVANPFDLENMLYMGTNVVSGSATAVVCTTGNRTYFGTLAERVTAADPTPTAFQTGVNKVSWLLIRFMLVMVPIVFLLNGFTKGDWFESFLFALSIAVGLTPEMLPMIVTSTLAKGAVVLSKQKVIVKRLDAIQSFGAMDVLCTDKTGTLTQDKIFLDRYTDAFGEESEEVLEYAYLNSYYQTGLKNIIDRTVLEHVEVRREVKVTEHYHKVDEIPFDFARRRMSVVVSERDDHNLLICKGALEEILSICTHIQQAGNISALTADTLAEIKTVASDLNQDGLRVVAVASRKFSTNKQVFSIADENDLTLLGYIAFLDPPKESTAPALEALKAHGVAVKILTGDNELVTAKICREVGIEIAHILLGSDIEKLDDVELSIAVEKGNVFAKLTPHHKERIVRALRANGHVVGFMGDGINDAPAIRAADIGISVDSAVDIAKEAADIILLEKSLMVLERGVIEGRKTFVNMLKYIKMAASSNFGNVFSVLIASIFLPFLPMLPLQILVQNLLYDMSQIAIPFDNVDEELLQKPQRWNPSDLGRFMVFFGPTSSIFDMVTFALMWFVFGANTIAHQSLFQSGWFVEGLLSQTLIVHLIRTRKIPFLQSRAAWPLVATTAAIMAVGVLLTLGPFASYFSLQSLPWAYYPCLLVILLAYMGLAQVVKGWFARRYGWQ